MEKIRNNYYMKRYKIIEYSCGDFGDMGSEIGYIDAKSKEEAWEKFKKQNNLTEQDKSYYSFR